MNEEYEEEKEQKTSNKGSFIQGAGKTVDKVKFVVKNYKVIGIIALVVIAIIVLCCFVKVVFDFMENDTNNTETRTLTSYSSSNATIRDADGNIINRVVLGLNNIGTGYEIQYDDSEDYLNNVREALIENDIDISDFSDLELAVFGYFMEQGTTFNYYTREKLECILPFLKAEACTQNLDLRPNSEKMQGGTYKPQKLEDLSENQVPGTVLVKRTNVKDIKLGGEPVTLEYIDKSNFDNLVSTSNLDVLNKFTIDENGNLVIAKWKYTRTTVSGTYPEEVSEEERINSDSGNNIIYTETINYLDSIKKYKMPFDFLIQLLVYGDDPNFCLDLVNYVLDSKIVINILEEEIMSTEVQDIEYTVTNKVEKFIDYEVTVNGSNVESETDYPLGQPREEVKDPVTVRIITETTDHSYKVEVSEVDNWLLKYEKTYTYPNPETSGNSEATTIQGQYGDENPSVEADVNDDDDVSQFIIEKENQYGVGLEEPILKIFKKSRNRGNYVYAQVDVLNVSGDYTTEPIGQPRANEFQEPFDVFDNPFRVIITEIHRDDGTTIPQVNYLFTVNKEDVRNLSTNDSNSFLTVYTSTDTNVECIVNKLVIITNNKIDREITRTTNTIKFLVGEEEVNSDIYTKDDEDNFVKFLAAYDNSLNAKNNLSSDELWLYESMEENEETVELIDYVKYLFYQYDGRDRGVTELTEEQIDELTRPGEIRFSQATGGAGGTGLAQYLFRYSHSSLAPRTER